MTDIRLGIDFGGTKIEIAALDPGGAILLRERIANPGAYEGAVLAVKALVEAAEGAIGGEQGTVGLGVPGSPSPRTGLIRNANSTWLNGRPFKNDLETALGRPVRMANDANCLALSEALDGAAAGKESVFAVILGTGCGGGLVIDGRLVEGAGGIAAELGHTPLPWLKPDEYPGPTCWCGLQGCLETWISGSGFQRDFEARTGQALSAQQIVEASRAGDAAARAALDAYTDRLGRALAVVANIVDPACFVLGGGMSNVEDIYAPLPAIIGRYAFSDGWEGEILQARWGDSSGVRGAAMLWD
ncbi:MAG: ROK family protein [Sphingobium sp.]|nr:ROK family protein [Sphingobium sp.]